jgi:hypothetical protein
VLRATTPTPRATPPRHREYYTTTYGAPSYYTEAPGSQVLLCPQLLTTPMLLSTTLFPETSPRLQLITPPKRLNTTPKRPRTTLPRCTQPQVHNWGGKVLRIPTYYTEAVSSYYVEHKYYTDALVYYTLTYATPSYNTEAPKYYTEEAAYYTTTYAAQVYFAEEPKYITLLQTTKAHKYYTSKASDYYTTTYAAPTQTPKFLSIPLPRATTLLRHQYYTITFLQYFFFNPGFPLMLKMTFLMISLYFCYRLCSRSCWWNILCINLNSWLILGADVVLQKLHPVFCSIVILSTSFVW